jgi:predicted HD phosphohydrolase
METVNFTQMKDGTEQEYRFLTNLEHDYVTGLPDRIVAKLADLANSLGGYQVDRLVHSLQTATRTQNDGADDEMVVAALIHDIGDDLAPFNHSQYAASILRPYVRPEVTWVVTHHGVFQNYYYAHFVGGDRFERDRYADHPWYQSCVDFCEKWDQASFDPDYPTPPLEHFAPLVTKIFSRQPFDPLIVGGGVMSSE